MNKGSYFVMELLQHFDKKELKDLQALTNCSYFNTEPKVFLFLNILIKVIKDSESLTEDSLVAVYNELYQADLVVLNKRQVNNIHAKMSLLHKLVQQFLMLESLKEDEKIKARLLQKQLLNKKLHRHYKKFLGRQRSKLTQQLNKDVDFYEHQYFVESEALGYEQQTGNLKKHNNTALVRDSFTLLFLLNQLDLYLGELYLKESVVLHQIDRTYYDALKCLLQLPQYAQNALIKVYQSVIDLMENKTDTAFFKLIEDLDQHGLTIPIGSKINFYNSLLNYCVFQVRSGKIEYKKHQFNLYKIIDQKKLLLTDNQMHIGNLRNIVSLSCWLKEFTWAEGILKKYFNFLPNDLRQEVLDFNLGVIAYYKKNYQQAIDYLFPLPTINLSHDINRRTIIMKAYYELNREYKETTHTLFRSFEKYIREHKSLTSKSKTSYKNFIRTLINLYRIKHGVTKMKLENLKQKLEAQKLNSNKSWLLEKVGEL